MTLDEIEELCVTTFPLSSNRPKIMDGLRHVVGMVESCKLKAEVWVDGGFLTEKIEPEDSDIVVRITGTVSKTLTATQQAVIDWIDANQKEDHLCDSYTFVEWESGSPPALQGIGEWCRAYWIKQFGFSRTDTPKGIAVVAI